MAAGLARPVEGCLCEDLAVIKEEYDSGTRIWTVVFGVLAMLVLQWVGVIAPRLANPPRDGNTWLNLLAIAIGLGIPVAWLVSDLKRYRVGLSWVVLLAVLTAWAVASMILAN